MRHLSNTFDHRLPKSRDTFAGYSYSEWLEGFNAIDRAWQRHLDWINKNVIGPPKATDFYTREQLEEMGMIGIYAKEGS